MKGEQGVTAGGNPAGGSSLFSSGHLANYPVFPTSIAACIPAMIDLMTDFNVVDGVQVIQGFDKFNLNFNLLK